MPKLPRDRIPEPASPSDWARRQGEEIRKRASELQVEEDEAERRSRSTEQKIARRVDDLKRLALRPV